MLLYRVGLEMHSVALDTEKAAGLCTECAA